MNAKKIFVNYRLLPVYNTDPVSEEYMHKQAVKEFYSKIKFPGIYTLDDLKFYDDLLGNKFLLPYDNKITGNEQILDIGCGTGFITNLIARRHPGVSIDAVDFSDSIDYAQAFGQQNNITNVNYFKQDFLEWATSKKYDIIISNGVLHHIERYADAINKAKNLLQPTGIAVLGIYNSYGKKAKKLFNINYRNQLLYLDQEQAPYETSFTHREFMSYFPDYSLESVYPGIGNQLVDLLNLFNYNNGGLTIYQLRKYAN